MPISFDPGKAAEVLGGMITPAVLISACGTLSLSTTNRLSRIVDRVRDLLKQAEALPAWNPTDEDVHERRLHIADQIAYQSIRIRYMQGAVIGLYVSITLLVGASLAIGLSAVGRGAFAWAPVVLGLLGALVLLVSAVLLIRDARLAVRSTLREMDYIHRTVARRTGAPLPPSVVMSAAESPPAA